MKKKVGIIFIILIVALTATGCIPGDGSITNSDPAGFFWGIWHGWLAPISLVIGIFDKNISIYEQINNGWWYDVGFYCSVISGFGGITFTRNKYKKNK